MKINYKELISKRIKILCVFNEKMEPIFYDCELLEYNDETKVLKIKDKFNQIIYIPDDAVREVVVVG